jgi:hypothetical protein
VTFTKSVVVVKDFCLREQAEKFRKRLPYSVSFQIQVLKGAFFLKYKSSKEQEKH